jgi:hypothetical protein
LEKIIMPEDQENSGENPSLVDAENAGTNAEAGPAPENPSQNAPETRDVPTLLKELKEMEARVAGLRRKMTPEPRAPEPPPMENFFSADDPELKTVLTNLGGEGDSASAVLKAMANAKMPKDAALRFLESLDKSLPQPKDAETIRREELAKLGDGADEIIRPLRAFRKTIAGAGWGKEDLEAFDRQTSTAEGVMVLSKVLQNASRLRSGEFSSRPGPRANADQPPQHEKVAAYAKAYAAMRTDPAAARDELKRLASLWE